MMTKLVSFARDGAGRSRLALPSLAVLALAAACEIPTKAIGLDHQWVVPSQSTRIAVADLLPAGVRILPDSSGFTVDLSAVSVSRTLSQDCAPCAAANGLTIPKPAFVASATATTSLPNDIASATLTGGSLQLVLQNGYNFDPLRPSAGSVGYAVVTVSNGATVIGKDSVNGATTALPAGGTLARTIPLTGTVTGSAPVTITVQINSPTGDPVRIDASGAIVATGTPVGLQVASASVNVVGRQVRSSSTIDLSDIDQSVVDAVKGGALRLDVANPFAVAGTLTVSLAPQGGAAINKSVALAQGASTPALSFTQTELRQLLGHVVALTFSGPVNGTSGAVTVTPKQTVVVKSQLDITLHLGPNGQ